MDKLLVQPMAPLPALPVTLELLGFIGTPWVTKMYTPAPRCLILTAARPFCSKRKLAPVDLVPIGGAIRSVLDDDSG